MGRLLVRVRSVWIWTAIAAIGCGDSIVAPGPQPDPEPNPLVHGPECHESVVLYDGRVEDLVVTERHLYVSTVLRIDKVSGALEDLPSDYQPSGYGAFGFAVASLGMFWFHRGEECMLSHTDLPPATGAIYQASVDGGASSVFSGEQYCPSAMAVDHEWVAWVNDGLLYWPSDSGHWAPAGYVAVSHGPGTHPYAMRNDIDFALADGWLYDARYSLRRVSLGDGSYEDIALDVGGVVSVDETYVYSAREGDVVRFPKSGNAAPEVVAAAAADTDRIGQIEARAPDYLYWTQADDTPGSLTTLQLVRMPKGGGPIETLFEGGPTQFVLDEDCAYLTVYDGSSVQRVIQMPR